MSQPMPEQLPYNPGNPLLQPCPVSFSAGVLTANGQTAAAITLRGPHGEFTALLPRDNLGDLIRLLKDVHHQLRGSGLLLPQSGPMDL